jgi:alcohol dehydrogenase (NADP+)
LQRDLTGCTVDLHTLDSGWGPTKYPVVVGHEIVGIVTNVGSEVTRVKIGQRVAVGAQVQSCHQCGSCNSDLEAYCPTGTYTYNSKYPDGTPTYGGYAK